MEDRNGESDLENGSAVKWDPLEDRWDGGKIAGLIAWGVGRDPYADFIMPTKKGSPTMKSVQVDDKTRRVGAAVLVGGPDGYITPLLLRCDVPLDLDVFAKLTQRGDGSYELRVVDEEHQVLGLAVTAPPVATDTRLDLEMVEERPPVQAIPPDYRRRACETCGHSEINHFSLMLGSRSHICHRHGRRAVVLWPEES